MATNSLYGNLNTKIWLPQLINIEDDPVSLVTYDRVDVTCVVAYRNDYHDFDTTD